MWVFPGIITNTQSGRDDVKKEDTSDSTEHISNKKGVSRTECELKRTGPRLNKSKQKRNRRKVRKSKKGCSKLLKIFDINFDVLLNKIHSFDKILEVEKSINILPLVFISYIHEHC